MKGQPEELSADLFKPFARLETDRFVLREITQDDAGSLFEIFSNPDVIEYWSHPPYESIDQARDLIERIRAGLASGEGVEWGITPRDDERRLLGKCGFHRWHKRHYRAEIGYSLGRSSWGQGIMKEALPRILSFGFQAMRLHSVEAQVREGGPLQGELLRGRTLLRHAGLLAPRAPVARGDLFASARLFARGKSRTAILSSLWLGREERLR
jgi:ribosomal-protein-alanine N-acetyltransferase